MSAPPLEKRWLERLVAAELARHGPDTAGARLPGELRQPGDDPAGAAHALVARSLRHRLDDAANGPTGALGAVAGHVRLVLNLAAAAGGAALDPQRARAQVAAFLAAAVGEHEIALAAYAPAAEPAPVERALRVRPIERALRAAELALELQLHPPGDPQGGLPLHGGHVAIQRRRLARVALGHHRDARLDPAALDRHREYAERETVLLVEAVAGLLAAAGPADAAAAAVRRRQLLRLGLRGARLDEARRALAAPRAADAVARAAPERVRTFLLEQLFLASLCARLSGEAPTRFTEAFAAGAGLDSAAVLAARVEAAAQHGDHHAWFEAFGEGAPSWQAFAHEWNGVADHLVERVSAAVTDNLDALATEIRETGELGALLARAAAGTRLTAEEKRKVRAQLVDVAKAVPALAIFAAPGGMLLLPLLAKLLPFSLLPSAWGRGAPSGRPRGAAPEDAAGAVAPAAPERKSETG